MIKCKFKVGDTVVVRRADDNNINGKKGVIKEIGIGGYEKKEICTILLDGNKEARYYSHKLDLYKEDNEI